jgi:hypothetical protein
MVQETLVATIDEQSKTKVPATSAKQRIVVPKGPMAKVRNLRELLGSSTRKSTEKAYEGIIRQLGDISTEAVLQYILRQVNECTSDAGVRRIMPAIRDYQKKSNIKLELDEKIIWEAIRAAKKVIGDNREEEIARPVLRAHEMHKVITRAREGDTTATVFSIQAFLAWRYDSLRQLRPEHITVDTINQRQYMSILMTKNKCRMSAPHRVHNIPVNIESTWPAAACWLPVIQLILQEKEAGAGSILHKLPDETTYRKNVQAMLAEVCNREMKRAGAHVARRTGATMHIEEGIPMDIVMRIGNWKNTDEFHKYIQETKSIVRAE